VFEKLLNPKAVISMKRIKPKPNKKLPAKSSQQKDMKHANQARNLKKTPKHQVHHQNRQWNNFPTSMPFSSYRSPMNIPWSVYFSMPYYCPSWFHNSYIRPLCIYLCQNYIIYREPAISKPSPTNNDRFDQKDRSI